MTHKHTYDPTELCAKAFRLALVAVICSLGHASLDVFRAYSAVPSAVAATLQEPAK